MTHGPDHAADTLDLVAKRLDFLRALDETTLDKRELTDGLAYSRSTVDRAVRDLVAAGLVVEDGGFTTSLKGRYLASLFESYRRDAGEVLELDAVTTAETADYPLPLDAVLGADVETSSGDTPYRPADVATEALDATDHGTLVFPHTPNRPFVERLVGWLSDGHACRIVAAESVVTALWRTAPHLLETVQTEPACELRVGDVPPFGLAHTVSGGEPVLTVVVYGDGGHGRSLLTNRSEAAVAWGRRRVQSLWEAAAPFDLGGDLAGDVQREFFDGDGDGDGDDDAPARDADGAFDDDHANRSSRRGDPLPTRLQSEGVVRLSPGYFDRVGVAPPLTCWRAGFDLGEVRAGYAIDRERPTETGRENLTDDLFDRLRDGTDLVVVGPPGAGKSTVCMSVACRWYDRERGPVVYRKSGHRESFGSTAHLSAFLASAPGHALVVVEDATRSEANAVFELVREFDDDPRVTFLLDSRESEWRDGYLVGDARLETHRTRSIEEVSVPPVDARERARLVEHFERTVGRPVDADPAELSPVGDDDLAPGEMYLFLHRLARHVESAAAGDSGPTALLDDVDGVYDGLRAVDEGLGVDVGILVNLLNASGVGVDVPLAYALSESSDDESLVEAALDALERSVLYPAFDGAGTDAVRTVHETWSTRFLQRLLDVESERRARRRFERCLAALFSLVDDADARRDVQSVFGGTADVVRAIDDDPGAWGERLVENVFELGVNNPTLSALYAETEYSAVEVPDACDPGCRLDVRRARARMFVNGGELDRAMREFEALGEFDDDAFDEETVRRARADGYAGVSEVLRHRSDFDRARAYAERAHALFDRVDDDVGRSDALNALGSIEGRLGNPTRAEEYFREALEYRRSVGDDVRVASTLANLADVERSLGRYGDAREHAHESLRLRRERGYRWGEAVSLSLLGIVELEDGSLDDAERYLRSSLDIRTDIGDAMGAASAANNYGRVELDRGRFEDARDRYVDLLETPGDGEPAWIRASAAFGLAETHLELGEYDAALERAVEATEGLVDDESGTAELLAIRARAHLGRGDVADAREFAREAFDRAASLGDEPRARANSTLGLLLVATGDVERGLDHLETAVEAAPSGVVEGRCRSDYADALLSVGRDDEALGQFERAVDCFESVDAGERARNAARRARDVSAGGDETTALWFETRVDE